MCEIPAPGTVYHLSNATVRSVLSHFLKVDPDQVDLSWDLRQTPDSDPADPDYEVHQLVVTILPPTGQ